jgi:hypothetical protein
MPKPKQPVKKKQKSKSPIPAEVTLQPAGEVVLTAQAVPPEPSQPKTIHERRFLPLIPEAPSTKPKD